MFRRSLVGSLILVGLSFVNAYILLMLDFDRNVFTTMNYIITSLYKVYSGADQAKLNLQKRDKKVGTHLYPV